MCSRSLERLRCSGHCVHVCYVCGQFLMWVLECLFSSNNLVLEIYAGFVNTSTVLLFDKRVSVLRHWPVPKNNPNKPFFGDCLKGARF